MPIFKSLLSRENWESKYRYGNETPLETFQRVSRALAEAERNYGATDEEVDRWADIFLKTLVDFEEVEDGAEGDDVYVDLDGTTLRACGLRATPGGRITANAGTDFNSATLLNCFINYGVKGAKISYDRVTPDGKYHIPVTLEGDTDTPDDLTNIMVALTSQALTLSNEGGYGVNFDFIRPRGSLIKGTGVRHPGVVAYMEVWDKVAEMIVRGDQDGYYDTLTNHLPQAERLSDEIEKAMPRKGAQMGCLSVWHPDIEEFVRAKKERGRLTKFNISVVVDDAFMRAVLEDDFYDLHFEGKVHKRIKARELYDLIMDMTYNYAEPGVLFFDNINNNNPIVYLGNCNATNPCLAEGSLVATEEGLVPVEEVNVGDRIQTTLGFAPVQSVEVHKDHPVFKVKFSDGTELRATEGHIFHTMCGSESRKRWNRETRLKDLEVGSWVRKAPYRHMPSQRTDLTRNDGFLAGYWLGDGSRSERGHLILAVNLSEDNSFLEKSLDEAGLVYHLDESGEGHSGNYRIQSSSAAEFFERVGLSPLNYSHEKSAPGWWLNTNKDFLAGVLDGLISSDGNINRASRYPAIRFKSTSKKLHDLFREICLYAGACYKLYKVAEEGEERKIYGRVVTRNHDVWEGHLTNDCIEAVYRFTGGLSHPVKDKDLREVVRGCNLTGTRWKVKVDSIEPDGTANVYDLYEPVADDWNTHGIVSRGCGEIEGNPYLTTVCLLGSLNLTRFVGEDRTFDWGKFEDTVKTFSRMLENVNDLGNVPLPEYQWALENVRQYGMGINGLGSAMYMMGIRYGSKESLEFVEKVNALKENLTWQVSANLAKARGPAPAYDEEAFLNTPWWKNNQVLTEETKALIREHGVRNLKTTTNPPLGNSSVICDMVSNGIEPVFAHGYERTIIADKWPEGLTQDNVKDVLTETKAGDATVWRGEYNGKTWYYEPHNRGLCFVDEVVDYGYDWVRTHYPEDVGEAEYLSTAQDLNVNDHVAVQAAVQRNINQACSKCLVKGQIVETTEGPLAIEDFMDCEPETEGFYPSKSGVKVYGYDGEPVEVTQAYYGGVKPCFRVRTTSGDVIECSNEHRFMTSSGWVRAEDLQEGDFLRTQKMNYQHGKGGAYLNFDVEDLGLRYFKKVTIPNQMSVELAELLGMIAADGHIKVNSFGLTEKNLEVGKRFDELCVSLFGYEPEIVVDKRNGVKSHNVSSTPLAALMEHCLQGRDSFSKRVPHQVMLGSLEEKKAFLSGVTLDGYARGNSFCLYAGVSKNLAEDIKKITRQIWGNVVHLGTKKSPSGNTVYLVHTYETEGLSPSEPHKLEAIFDVSPEGHLVELKTGTLDKLEYVSSHPNYASFNSLRQRQPEFVQRKTARKHNLDYFEGVQVASVEAIGDFEVYDIEVGADHHSYLVEGVITHNTVNLPNDYPFEDFKDLYIKAWRAGLKGFTTYRAGTMEAVLAVKDDKADSNTTVKAESLLELLRDLGCVPDDVEVTAEGVVTREVSLPDTFNNGQTRKLRADGNKYYMHLSYLPEDGDWPIALWIHSNGLKPGEYVSLNRAIREITKLLSDSGVAFDLVYDQLEKVKDDPHHVKLGKMISMCMRHCISLPKIVAALTDIEDDHIASTLTAVRKFLKLHIEDGVKAVGIRCQSCGSENLVYESGCDRCLDCGYSGCG